MATGPPDGATTSDGQYSATISVHNISNFDEQKLELLFENRNRSNGGNVRKVEIHRELNVAYVTFEEQEVAERVLDKGEILFDGSTLKIRPGPQIDPFSILVLGLAPETTREILELYFESPKRSGGGTVENVAYEDGRSWACVTFKSKEVTRSVLDHRQKLCGVDLATMPRVMPNAVEVYPINGVDEEVLELYFDSRRHGGNVTSCHTERGVAVIHFEDCEVLKRVLGRKHTVEGHDLQVDVYYSEVGITHAMPSLSDKPPSPFSIALPHPGLQAFWDHSPEVTTWLKDAEDRLGFCTDIADGVLNITYKSNGFDARSPEIWTQEVGEEVNGYLKRIHARELPASEICLLALDAKCSEVCSDSVLAICDNSARSVIIVGFEKFVNLVEATLKETIKRLSIIENTIPLPDWQLHLMQVTNHVDYMRHRIPGLDVVITDAGLELRGEPEHLQMAFSLVYDDFVSNCVQQYFQMDDSVFGALQNQSLYDGISKNLKLNNILAVIELNDDNDMVIVHALSDADAERCSGLIIQSLVHKRIQFPAHHRGFFWSETHSQLLEASNDSVVISSDVQSGILDMYCWHDNKNILEKILESLRPFITEECLLPLPIPVLYLLVAHHVDRIKTITDNLNHAFSNGILTTIDICDPDEIGGYIIHGSAEGITFAMEELQKLAAEVVPVDVPLVTHSVLKYVLSSSGQAFLEDVTGVRHVVAVVDDDVGVLVTRLKQHLADSKGDQPGVTVAPSHVIRLSSGLKIKIHSRDLRSSSLDMIVIPADKYLKHTLNSVSQLINYAGFSVCKACEQHLQDKKDQCVSVGSLWETGTGNLKCTKLLHLVCPAGDLMLSADNIVQEAIAACMEHIKNAGVKSVAFKVLEVVPGQRIPLMAKAQIIARTLATTLLDDQLTVNHIELVSNDSLFSQIMKDVLLRVLLHFGINADAEMENGATAVSDKPAGEAACGCSEASEGDSHNIRLYGLNASDVESAAMEVKSKCDEICRDLSASGDAKQEERSDRNGEQTEGDGAGLGASGGLIDDSELGATGGAEASSSSSPEEQYYWEYISDDGAYEPFMPDICDLLETTYREDPSATIEYLDEAGRRQIVDFPTMRKYNARDPRNCDNVRRVAGTFSLDPTVIPSKWDPMMPGERLKVVELAKDSSEYEEVEKSFLASAKYNITIEKIKRIQNPLLYQQYKVKKKQMDKLNDVLITNQRRLYHGTDESAINNINTNGFNRSYCGKNATVYGRGVYFAREASYSLAHLYSPYDMFRNRHCYQCLVLTGEYTTGKDFYIEPPAKDPVNPAIHYDSVVNDLRMPDMYIIFNDTQAYPEYLITFKDKDP